MDQLLEKMTPEQIAALKERLDSMEDMQTEEELLDEEV